MTPPSSSLSKTTTALLIGAIALVLGSMGGAVAGSLVTSADIKNGSVKSKDIRDKSIKSRDLSPMASARVSGYQLVDESVDAVADDDDLDVRAGCGSGRRILGVSGYWEADNEAVQVFVRADGREATAYADNPSTVDPDTLHVRIICGNVT